MPSYPNFLSGGAYRSQSRMADDELMVNWFVEKNESAGAPQPYVMLPTPGVESFASVGQAPIRGLFHQNGRAGFIAGFAFYELFADGTTILRGTVNNDGHPVTFSSNGDAGNQWWITSGGTGYIFDLTSNLLSVEGNPGTVVSMGGFLAARFLYLDATQGFFYASAQYDGTSWAPLMVAQSQSGDPWRALIVTPDGLIRLLGESSGECWADQGTFPFPFSQISEAAIPFGIVSPWAWAVDTTVNWLAQSVKGRGVMVRANGYAPQRISTHAIEQQILDYTTLDDVTAFSHGIGHAFVVVTFPTAETTWAFDTVTGLWHQRDYWDVTTGVSKAYRLGCAVEAFGTTLAGDRLTGDIYELSAAFQTDVDGAVIRRVRQPPRLANDQNRLTIDSLELVLDTGIGVATGQGVDPVVMLQTSRNAGQTFGSLRSSSAGAGGNFEARCRWLRCGQARNFVPRFIATDPVPWGISDCIVNFRQDAS